MSKKLSFKNAQAFMEKGECTDACCINMLISTLPSDSFRKHSATKPKPAPARPKSWRLPKQPRHDLVVRISGLGLWL